MPGGSQLSDGRRAFLGHLVDGDLDGARRLVARLLAHATPEQVILDVLAPTQGLVGRRWEVGQLNVGAEHVATAITDAVLAQVSAAIALPPSAPTIALACVEGDWHSVPARMATELLRARGLPVRFLGASLPSADLGVYLAELQPAALCLTCSVPAFLPGSLRSIEAAHATGTPVMAGGRGFGPDSHAARRLGADGWARSTARAVARLATWSADGGPARLATADVDLADWAAIEVEVGALADRLIELVGEVVPHVQALADGDASVDDLGSLVEYLGVTLLLDDDRIFASHVAWLARVLTARGLPAGTIADALPALTLALAESDQLTARAQRALLGAQAAANRRPTQASEA